VIKQKLQNVQTENIKYKKTCYNEIRYAFGHSFKYNVTYIA